MDWGSIGTAVIGIILALWAGIRTLSGDHKRQREEDRKQRKTLQRQQRKSFRWGDLLMGWIYEQRMNQRRHNAAEHPTGEGAFEVAEIPPDISDGIRVYVGDENEEEDDE